jgi:hypothetical protein
MAALGGTKKFGGLDIKVGRAGLFVVLFSLAADSWISDSASRYIVSSLASLLWKLASRLLSSG